MAFNVSSISTYTDQTSQPLIKKAILTGKSMSLLTNKMPGVKYKEALNILTNTITIAAQACGWSAAGSIAFKQRVMTVTGLQVQDALCPITLEKYWMGQMMNPGTPKDVELGQILADSYVEKIKEANETMLWAGQSGATSFSGFVELLTNDGGYISVSAASGAVSGHTTANIVGRVDAMVAAITGTTEVLYKLGATMFMSRAVFNMYIAAMATANLYHINPLNGLEVAESWTNPLNSVKFIAIDGLAGKQDLILSFIDNMVIGTDMLNEEETFDIWYERGAKEVRVDINWKLGVQVHLPELVIYNK